MGPADEVCLTCNESTQCLLKQTILVLVKHTSFCFLTGGAQGAECCVPAIHNDFSVAGRSCADQTVHTADISVWGINLCSAPAHMAGQSLECCWVSTCLSTVPRFNIVDRLVKYLRRSLTTTVITNMVLCLQQNMHGDSAMWEASMYFVFKLAKTVKHMLTLLTAAM